MDKVRVFYTLNAGSIPAWRTNFINERLIMTNKSLIEQIANKLNIKYSEPLCDMGQGKVVQGGMLVTQLEMLAEAYHQTKRVKSAPFVCAPDGEIRCDASTGHVYGVYWYESVPSLGTKVYIAARPSDADAKLKIAIEALKFYANLDWKDNTELFQQPAKQALEKIGEL